MCPLEGSLPVASVGAGLAPPDRKGQSKPCPYQAP
jgi:hypothetical protein